MEPLHQPFGLRVGRFADLHLRRQGAAELLTGLGQLDPLPPPAADRTLTVPDQHPRHSPERGDDLPPAVIQIFSRPGRHKHRGGDPGVAADHRQHRQELRRPELTETDRQVNVGEPEVALGDLPGRIHRPTSRVRRQIRLPQLRHPTTQRADPVRPADPLSDHRRRHRRHRFQQLPDPRLEHIDP